MDENERYEVGERVWLYYGNAWNTKWHRATIVEARSIYIDIHRQELIVRTDDPSVILHGPGVSVTPPHPSLKRMSALDRLAELE